MSYDAKCPQPLVAPPALRPQPSKLFVETTSHCNLNCAMCVKQTSGAQGGDGEMSSATFDSLLPAMGKLETLILNGVGESLLHPQLEEFVRRARQVMPASGVIAFQSNGLLLDRKRARSLAAAGLDKVCLSVDAVTPATFRELRDGGELQAMVRAFAALREARAVRPSLKIGVEFVLMRQNLHQLCDTLRWAARQGAEFALISHLLPYGEEALESKAYPDCTEAAIELFDRWRTKGAEAGIDIGRYFDIAFRFAYGRSKEEERVLELVAGMKREAEEQGIFFDLKKLLQLDREFMANLDATFAEAAEIAEEVGLELQLPGVIPTAQRRCEFIEEGSAFVSWDGRVHPCYFLWHGYTCHASGWEQQVQARSFGSVSDQGLLEIWNGEEFSAFRRSVLDYDYPFCYACTLAPCDYIQTDDFEQDCHVRNEPCGSCLWCMGLFQCLR